MEFRILILIISILFFIIYHIYNKPIYRDSPANSNYRPLAVHVVFIYYNCTDYEKDQDIKYNIDTLIYAHKWMTCQDVANYIAHHKYLFKEELEMINDHYTDYYKSAAKLKAVEVNVDSI